MTRLLIVALVIAAGCSGKHKKATTTKGEPVIARRLSVGWGFQPAADMPEQVATLIATRPTSIHGLQVCVEPKTSFLENCTADW